VNDRGIGGAIVDRFAEEGAAVCVLWHNRPKRVIRRLERANHAFIDTYCDVTDQNSINEAIDQCMSEFGQIDIVVNNAGVEISKSLEETTDEDWHQLIDVNLTGSMRVARSVTPLLTEEEGVIVNISSVLGIAGCSGFPAYSASKAGLIGLTQSLAMELAPRGIRSVCVAPALVHTPMTQKYLKDDTDVAATALLESSHPLGIGTPHDVASAVAFLASSEARWITGVTLPLGWASTFSLPTSQPAPPAAVPQPIPSAAALKEELTRGEEEIHVKSSVSAQ